MKSLIFLFNKLHELSCSCNLCIFWFSCDHEMTFSLYLILENNYLTTCGLYRGVPTYLLISVAYYLWILHWSLKSIRFMHFYVNLKRNMFQVAVNYALTKRQIFLFHSFARHDFEWFCTLFWFYDTSHKFNHYNYLPQGFHLRLRNSMFLFSLLDILICSQSIIPSTMLLWSWFSLELQLV